MEHMYLNEHTTFKLVVFIPTSQKAFQVRTLEKRLSGIVAYSFSRVQFYSKP